MKLMQDIILEQNGQFRIIPRGTIIESAAATIDVDPASLQSKSYSTQDLAKMVEKWISKNRALVDQGKLNEQEWDYIASHLLQLIKVLIAGNKQAVVDHKNHLQNNPPSNQRLAKLHKAVLGVYNEIGSKLGSFEIMGDRILNRENYEILSATITESLDNLLVVISG